MAAASLFALAPLADRFGAVVFSTTLVWLSVVLALAASGTATALGVAAGAVGAFGAGVLVGTSPAVAGAVVVAAAFTERTLRVRSSVARAVHVGAALTGGALAGSVAAAYAGASVPVLVVAIVVAAALAALPLLVDADDPVAYALTQAAAVVAEPARRALRDGAELRRCIEDVQLDATARARVRTTWQSLLRLSEARVRLERTRERPRVDASEPAQPSAEGAVVTMLDQRIAEHVAVLARAYTALDVVSAAALGLDDAALKNVASIGDSLEETSRAIVEVKAST